MDSNHNIRIDSDSTFSYGVRELKQAKTAPDRGVAPAPIKAANEQRGCDPYNTSSSFDRKKNWARGGKR